MERSVCLITNAARGDISMAYPAGTLNNRWRIQSATVSSLTDSGEEVRTWATDATVWGGRMPDTTASEIERADATVGQAIEMVQMRYRAGLSSNRRLLLEHDKTDLAANINSTTTTVTLAAVLRFDGSENDYLVIGSEVMRVISGGTTTTLTVQRGALETTAASHTAGASVRRISKYDILAVVKADELKDEIEMRVRRDG